MTVPNPIVSPPVPKHTGETKIFALAFPASWFEDGESIATVVSVTDASDELTIEDEAKNGAELTTRENETVAVGHAVLMTVSGGEIAAGSTVKKYYVQVTVTTTDGQTLVGVLRIDVYGTPTAG